MASNKIISAVANIVGRGEKIASILVDNRLNARSIVIVLKNGKRPRRRIANSHAEYMKQWKAAIA